MSMSMPEPEQKLMPTGKELKPVLRQGQER
jgi:hypothetical protein